MAYLFCKSDKAAPVLPASAKSVEAFVLELVEDYATSSDSRSFMKEHVEDIGLNVHDVVEILILAEDRYEMDIDDECIDPDDISELKVVDLVRIVEIEVARKPAYSTHRANRRFEMMVFDGHEPERVGP